MGRQIEACCVLVVCLLGSCALAELIVTGDGITWTYIRNGERFYISNEGIAVQEEEDKGKFNVSESYCPTVTDTTTWSDNRIHNPSPEEFVCIQIMTWNGTLIGIGEDGSIGPSNYPTAFELYGINDTFFTLQPNSLEPLVTRNSRAPFRFYAKSVYPDEVDALFHFEASPFDISAIYNCTRANTVVAFEAIRGNPNIDRAEEYENFVDAIESCDHFRGIEVFLVASVIKAELGASSSTFQKFPALVKTIVFNEETNEEFFLVMRRNDSSFLNKVGGVPTTSISAAGYGYDSLKPIHPFKFIRSNSSIYTNTWFIIYNEGQYLQIATPNCPDCQYPIMLNTKQDFYYTNGISLQPDLQTFTVNIRNYGSIYGGSACNATICNLYCGSSGTSSNRVIFSIEPYTFSFEDYYERSDIFVYMDLIRRRYSGAEIEAGMAKLLTLMGSKGHLVGNEIFTVASILLREFGEESDIYQSLPYTVKFIVSGKPFRLNYKTESGLSFPMKYSWASDQHLQIGNFSFSHNTTFGHLNMRHSAFALTYQNEYQIVVDSGTEELVDIRGGSKSFGFYPELNESLDGFTLSWGTTLTYHIYTNQTEPDFYFSRSNRAVERAVFEIENSM